MNAELQTNTIRIGEMLTQFIQNIGGLMSNQADTIGVLEQNVRQELEQLKRRVAELEAKLESNYAE